MVSSPLNPLTVALALKHVDTDRHRLMFANRLVCVNVPLTLLFDRIGTGTWIWIWSVMEEAALP